MTTSLSRLCDRIHTAIGHNDNAEEVFRALVTILTHRLSLLCPDCRTNVADELRQRIPDMLSKANAAAAQRTSAGEQAHTCH